MKKTYLWMALVATLLVTGCTNLDFFERRLDDYEARLQKLENQVSAANRDMVAIREMIKAQANAITIKEYRPLDDNSGYVLTMSDGSKIVLKNGLNGQSSSIGVKKGEDRLLYWTLNGEYMHDSDGNKIQAKGEDGKNGITPQLRVNSDGFWEYSLGGQVWHLVLDSNFAPVKATGGGTNDLDITESNGYLVIKFKGQTFIISLTGGGNGGSVTPPGKPTPVLTLETTGLNLLEGNSTLLNLKVAPDDVYSLSDVTWASSNPDVAKVENGTVTGVGKGEATITASIGEVSVKCTVKVSEKLKIDIEILEVSAIYAQIKFTPSDQSRSYRAGVYEKSMWLKNGADKKGTFETLDLPFWKSFSEQWWNLLDRFLEIGIKTYEPYELGCPLSPETAYVVIAYGIDSDGNITGDEYIKEFTTGARTKYDDSFTFKIEVLDPQPRSISAVVVPSDDTKTYIATIQSKSFGDSYIDKPDSYEKMAFSIAGNGREASSRLKKGRDIVMRENRLPNTEYYIIIFGYDLKKGLTTKPTFEKVKTKTAN